MVMTLTYGNTPDTSGKMGANQRFSTTYVPSIVAIIWHLPEGLEQFWMTSYLDLLVGGLNPSEKY